MSANHARQPCVRKDPPETGSSPRLRAPPRRQTQSLECTIKEALASLDLGPEVDLVCEVVSGVGDLLQGDVGRVGNHVARAIAEARSQGVPAGTRQEFWVRFARQQAGFEPTDRVLVTVSTGEGAAQRELLVIEPRLGREPTEEEDLSIASRVLVVTPSALAARVHRSAAVSFGAHASSVREVEAAVAELRSAALTRQPYDTVFVDDALPDRGRPLLALLTSDATLGRPAILYAVGAGAVTPTNARTTVIAKPVLPREFARAVTAAEMFRRPKRTPSPRIYHRLKVLVAEDDPLVARLTVNAVVRLGHEPALVTTGLEAVEALRSGQYDYAILDAGLPELDGISAALWVNRLRAPTDPKPGICIVSAAPVDARRCADAGVDRVLAKPLRDIDLAAALKEVNV